MLHIYLLGNPKISDDARSLPLPAPGRAFLLWAYLLLKREYPTPREQLAYILWPDVPESEARANLRRHLHLLRKQLPPAPADTPWILATRHTLQWNPAATYRLDVALVEDFNPQTADKAQWTALLEGYRGDLLTGQYDDWVLVERERLHQRFLRLCETRLAQQRASGDLSGALVTARRLLAHDPLREEPYRWLMELHYRLGDRAAALRAFEQCETMLRTELDVPPMPETLALRDAILSGEERPPAPPPAAQMERPPPTQAETGPPPPRRFPRRAVALALLIPLLVAGLLAARQWFAPEPSRLVLAGPAVVQDTWLNFLYPDLPYDPEWSQDPYAVYPQVHLSYWGYPYDRVLLRFDLEALPLGAEVQQATLHLHLEPFLNKDLTAPRPATLSAFRLLTDWQAETATFDAPWSQPGLAPGVDFDAEALDDDSLHGSDWIDLDVTEAVQEWQAHPDRNFGLVIMITAAPQGAHYWVDTTDYPLPDRQPRLEIAYKP